MISANITFIFAGLKTYTGSVEIKSTEADFGIDLYRSFRPIADNLPSAATERCSDIGIRMTTDEPMPPQTMWVFIHRLQELLSSNRLCVHDLEFSPTSLLFRVSRRASPVQSLCKISVTQFDLVLGYLCCRKDYLHRFPINEEPGYFCAFVARNKDGVAIAMQGSSDKVPSPESKRLSGMFPLYMVAFPEETETVNMLYGMTSKAMDGQPEFSGTEQFSYWVLKKPMPTIRKEIQKAAANVIKRETHHAAFIKNNLP
jgi:hypothetical protein